MNFDASFLSRLKQRDPDTCAFLVSSLTPALEARLRYRLRDRDAIEDVRNETFYRVFYLVDDGRVRQPERFGSFVCGVCDLVAQETRRKARTTEPLPFTGIEAPGQPHPDKLLVDRERRALVWHQVMKLSEADRRLLVEMHLEERDRREMARDRGISMTGLNVRLCRALKRLRALVLLPEPAKQAAREPCRPRLHVPLTSRQPAGVRPSQVSRQNRSMRALSPAARSAA
jgi:RNA polymerase sigma-70 factor (ECF subfamily)